MKELAEYQTKTVLRVCGCYLSSSFCYFTGVPNIMFCQNENNLFPKYLCFLLNIPENAPSLLLFKSTVLLQLEGDRIYHLSCKGKATKHWQPCGYMTHTVFNSHGRIKSLHSFLCFPGHHLTSGFVPGSR